jgi:hypothetical protein
MPAILLQHALTVLSAALWWLLLTGVGLLCLGSSFRRTVARGEILFVSFGIGLVIVGYSVFLLGVAGALRPIFMAGTLSCLAVLALAGWRRRSAASKGPMTMPPALLTTNPGFRGFKPGSLTLRTGFGLENPVGLIAGFALLLLLAAAFVLTLTPESGKDALIYHLAVPKLYLQHGGFYSIPGNIFADYPLLAEMHYLIALFLQNDILAKMMNYVVLLEILLGIGLFSRFLLREHAFPALSMLIFLSIPSVFAVSHAAYNDLFVAFFTLAAFHSFLRWSQNRLTGWLAIFGVFTGAAIACKYTVLLTIPLGVLGILFFALKDKFTTAATLRALVVYTAALLAAGSPFYLKNWLVTGNPFHPFLYAIFGGKGWDADQARLYDIMVQSLGMGRSLCDYILLPFNLSFRAKFDNIAFDGIMGPVFFFTLPFLVFVRRQTALFLIMVFSFFSFLFWASSAQQVRYLVPIFPLLAIVAGAILTGYRKQKRTFPLLVALIAGSLACNACCVVHDFIKIAPLRVVSGMESRENFLGRLIPAYPMYRFANENLPANAKVFLIYMKNYTFLCEQDCFSDSMFETHTIGKIIRASSSPEEIGSALKKRGFTHLMYDERYLVGAFTPLSPEEQTQFSHYQQRFLTPVVKIGPYKLGTLLTY